jgi:hypothetical protein
MELYCVMRIYVLSAPSYELVCGFEVDVVLLRPRHSSAFLFLAVSNHSLVSCANVRAGMRYFQQKYTKETKTVKLLTLTLHFHSSTEQRKQRVRHQLQTY